MVNDPKEVMPSTVIQTFSYKFPERILIINFLSGNCYAYINVPESIYKEFKTAYSKGKYFNAHIKNHYPFKQVDK